jgi:glycerophosphoryl diester phosphodiesterase
VLVCCPIRLWLQVTADGVPVLWHDDRVVWRQPDGSAASTAIADLTLPEFSALLVCSWAALRSFAVAGPGFATLVLTPWLGRRRP